MGKEMHGMRLARMYTQHQRALVVCAKRLSSDYNTANQDQGWPCKWDFQKQLQSVLGEPHMTPAADSGSAHGTRIILVDNSLLISNNHGHCGTSA